MKTINLPPFFIGGPMHGTLVPRSLAAKHNFITVHGLGADAVYVRSIWWLPMNQSFRFFFDATLTVGEMADVMNLMLGNMRSDDARKQANRGNF